MLEILFVARYFYIGIEQSRLAEIKQDATDIVAVLARR